jgi:hypothetical protein
MKRQVSHSSAGNYPADEQVGITQLSWQLSSRLAARNHAAHLAIIKQITSQESRSSAGNYQADEQAGITHLSWQFSSS